MYVYSTWVFHDFLLLDFMETARQISKCGTLAVLGFSSAHETRQRAKSSQTSTARQTVRHLELSSEDADFLL